MLRLLLICLFLSISAPALAVYKCGVGDKTTYSDAPCPGGKVLNVSDRSDNTYAEAQQQAAQEKRKLAQLENQRHKREAQEERQERQAQRIRAARQKKCAALAQRRKWSEEDAAHAAGKSAAKAQLKARRMAEKQELECGKG